MPVSAERTQIFLLLARALDEGRLPPHEEARLRGLMLPHNRFAATLEWDALLHAGLVMTGAWLAFEPETVAA